MNIDVFLYQLANSLEPSRLGELVSKMNSPTDALGRGIFETRAPGMIGKGPIQSYGTMIPEVRK